MSRTLTRHSLPPHHHNRGFYSSTRSQSEILGTTVLVYLKFSQLSMHIYDICSVAIQCQTNCLCLNFLSSHSSMIEAVAASLVIVIEFEGFYV